MKNILFVLTVILFGHSSMLAEELEYYKCFDDRGRPSFADTPCHNHEIKGQSGEEKLWLNLRDLVVEGMQITKSIGPTVEEIKLCNKHSDEYAIKVASLSDRVRSFQEQYPSMVSAHSSLTECGKCRVSSLNQCYKSEQQLQLVISEMIDLKMKDRGYFLLASKRK